MDDLIQRIFNIDNDDAFNEVALEVFRYQKNNIPIYGQFIDLIGAPLPTSYKEIPFLPISFFKTHKLINQPEKAEIIFKSSGTEGIRSTHYLEDVNHYKRSFLSTYINEYGDPKDQVILALLPNYIEQGFSSLVYMVNTLIEKSKSPLSGFFLGEYSQLMATYSKAVQTKKKVILFGVSYALLDLAEFNADFSEATIIETGGMKGKRKEMTKTELHAILSRKLNCEKISSEYGMTELLSQAYCKRDLLFKSPSWMKVLIREINDPLRFCDHGKTGGINIIDLANINSVSFIATQDLGRASKFGFEIMGRFDHADIRGCNLLVQ
jgi:hypothetical protein